MAVSGCSESDPMSEGDGAAEGFSHAAMLDNLSTGVIQPTQAEFLTAAERLEAAVEAWQKQVGADDLQAAAQQAWRDAMVTWSRAEMMQIGPAASPTAPGAESLRDEIYSWTTVSACSVDQQIVAQSYVESDFIDNKLVNVYGLDALEYLLFYVGSENACPTASAINRDGQWSAIAMDEIVQRRADYAVAVAKGIGARARTLHDRWDPASGDFGGQLVAAAVGDQSVYSNVGQAIDAVYAGMFYVDTAVKDTKLGRTTGLGPDCAEQQCGVEQRESVWADHSLENIVGNLEALQLLYYGGTPGSDGVGFDDFLRHKEADGLAVELGAAIDHALETARATTTPMSATLVSDPAALEALHAAVKAVTDPLKNEFVIVLQVTVPTVGKGDTD
ncbi:MAG: imelysin family protein [Myxococcota bacterium]